MTKKEVDFFFILLYNNNVRNKGRFKNLMRKKEVKKVSYKKTLAVAITVAVLSAVSLVLIFMQAETFTDIVTLSTCCLLGVLLYVLTGKR